MLESKSIATQKSSCDKELIMRWGTLVYPLLGVWSQPSESLLEDKPLRCITITLWSGLEHLHVDSCTGA